MDISKFTKFALYIPPAKVPDAISVIGQETIFNQVSTYLNKLKQSGITHIGCIGGMHLDYERYLPEDTFDNFKVLCFYPHLIPDVESINLLLEKYTLTDEQTLLDELDMFDEKITLLNMIGEYSEQVEMQLGLQFKNKYDLATIFAKQQKFIITFNEHLISKPFRFTKTYKDGIKLSLTQSTSEWFLYGKQTRETLIFK